MAKRRRTSGDTIKKNIRTFLVEYMVLHHGMSPGFREIGKGANCSMMSVQKYLKALEQDGVVILNGRRGIEMVGSRWIPPDEAK